MDDETSGDSVCHTDHDPIGDSDDLRSPVSSKTIRIPDEART